MEKLLPLANFFLSISLSLQLLNQSIYEQNEAIKGYQLRQQIKKINQNLYKDILDYSETELRKNPKNTLMLIAKSYALMKGSITNRIKRRKLILLSNFIVRNYIKRRSVTSTCYLQKILVFKINLRNLVIINLKEYSQAITCLDQALEINPQYIIAYNNKGQYLTLIQRIIIIGNDTKLIQLYMDQSNSRKQSFALTKLYNQILIFQKLITIKDYHYRYETEFIYLYMDQNNSKMQLFALTKPYNQILVMPEPITIRVIHYKNQIEFIQFYMDYNNTRMQLFAMTKPYNQILMMPKPKEIEVIYYSLFSNDSKYRL